MGWEKVYKDFTFVCLPPKSERLQNWHWRGRQDRSRFLQVFLRFLKIFFGTQEVGCVTIKAPSKKNLPQLW